MTITKMNLSANERRINICLNARVSFLSMETWKREDSRISIYFLDYLEICPHYGYQSFDITRDKAGSSGGIEVLFYMSHFISSGTFSQNPQRIYSYHYWVSFLCLNHDAQAVRPLGQLWSIINWLLLWWRGHLFVSKLTKKMKFIQNSSEVVMVEKFVWWLWTIPRSFLPWSLGLGSPEIASGNNRIVSTLQSIHEQQMKSALIGIHSRKSYRGVRLLWSNL